MTKTLSKSKEWPGVGTFFTLIVFVLLVIGGLQFSGGSPINHLPSGTQVVDIVTNTPEPAKNNLQLYTFGGVTPDHAPTGVASIAGSIPGQIVNLRETNPTGNQPEGSIPECGTASSPSSDGSCCVRDGPVKKASDCCPGIPTCKEIMDNPGKYAGGNGQPKYSCASTDPNFAALWCDAKPVIYLYPKAKTLVSVSLRVPGTIPVSDPLYPENGWKNIESYPDGTFHYHGKIYNELFYEANITPIAPPKNGIIVSKDNLKTTLVQITTKLGLTTVEQKEFLNYWTPKLSELNFPYILISVFTPQQKDIIDHVDITPKPDTFIQFIMYFKPLQNHIEIQPLQLPAAPPHRIGFTAVEWGGIIDR